MAKLRPYNGGWFVAGVSGRATEFDRAGCGGMYIESVKIRWWHPMAWFMLLKDLVQRRWPTAPKDSPIEMRLGGLSRIEYEMYGIQRFIIWFARGFLPQNSRAWRWCGDWLQGSWWRKFFKGMGR